MAAEKAKPNKPRKILLCGAYGMENLGDEASCEAIIARLRALEKDVSICLVTHAPDQARILYGVSAVGTYDFIAIHRELKSADALILGGGSLLQSVTSRRNLYYYLALIKKAKKLGCTVMLWGCGIGPIDNNSDLEKTARILNDCADVICLRDEKSLALLSSLGVARPEILLSADPVFSLNECSGYETMLLMQDYKLLPDAAYIGVCLRSWRGFDDKLGELCEALMLAHENLGLTPVFFVLNFAQDLVVTMKAAEKLKCDCCIIPRLDSAAGCMGLMSAMSVFVSVRLHGAVLAAMSGVPCVGISYDPKVEAFFDRLGCGKCVDISCSGLYEAISSAYNEDKAFLNRRINELKTAEAVNGHSAARYIFAERTNQ